MQTEKQLVFNTQTNHDWVFDVFVLKKIVIIQKLFCRVNTNLLVQFYELENLEWNRL